MGTESEGFGPEDLDGFLRLVVERDRLVLAGRLEAASRRLEGLLPRIEEADRLRPAEGAGDGAGPVEWDARGVLAHIAVLSRFYGALTYRIGTGKVAELDLLAQVRLRDPAAESLAGLAAATLVETAVADHRRTAAYLREAGAEELGRTADLGGLRLSAQDVARLALCAHLEAHLDQLEAVLPPSG